MSGLRIPRIGDRYTTLTTVDEYRVAYADQDCVVLEREDLASKIRIPWERFTEWFQRVGPEEHPAGAV